MRPAALALLLACGVAQAQPPAMSLADAFESAWQRTALAAEAAGQLRRAQAERAGSTALWAAPPALELGVLRNRQRPLGTSRETEVGLAVPVWLPGQRAARQEQVEAEVSAATAQAAAARLQVAGQVREAAGEVALQRADLAAAQAQSRQLDNLAQDVARRVAAGDLARADALAAEAERLAALTALAQSRQGLQAALSRWQALTGLADAPVLDEAAARHDAASADTLAHPALQAAQHNLALARERVHVARLSRRDAPELLIKARQEAPAGEPRIHGLGLALRLPLGTAGRNEPLMAAALSAVELAEAQLRELQQQLDTEQALARHAEASTRQQALDETARGRLLRERAELIAKSFQAGETALPDMLRAVTAATQAEAAAARAHAARAQAASRLQQALGTLP